MFDMTSVLAPLSDDLVLQLLLLIINDNILLIQWVDGFILDHIYVNINIVVVLWINIIISLISDHLCETDYHFNSGMLTMFCQLII
jgi:hypothetical protein